MSAVPEDVSSSRFNLPDKERFKEGLVRIPAERLSVADLVKVGEIEKAGA